MHLLLQVLKKEALEDAELEAWVVLQDLEHEEGSEDVLLSDLLKSDHKLLITTLSVSEVSEGLDPQVSSHLLG